MSNDETSMKMPRGRRVVLAGARSRGQEAAKDHMHRRDNRRLAWAQMIPARGDELGACIAGRVTHVAPTPPPTY